jgi:hypothetical protein
VLCRAPRQGFADAALRPPLTRHSAPESVVSSRSRLCPVVQVRPSPDDNAPTQANRRRKRSIGNPAIDRRAANAGQLYDDGQAHEKALGLFSVR